MIDQIFLLRLADNLDKEADARRERAIVADRQREPGPIKDDIVDRWVQSFATSYQTLRGIAAAIRATAS